MAFPVPRSLSPSKVSSFTDCALAFRFSVIDRLPEPPSPAATKGTLVHAALERLHLLPPDDRTLDAALACLADAATEMRDDPDYAALALSGDDESAVHADAAALVRHYFRLEDPRKLTARRLEWRVEYELSDVHLRGVVDRLEIDADGSWTLTDYKTGRVPGERREQAAFFGLRFYALVCWRAFGVMPKSIRLVYLSDPAVLSLEPHERMLVAFERQMKALAAAVRRALARDDFRARPSPFCMSCPHQERCPAWAPSRSLGETPPR